MDLSHSKSFQSSSSSYLKHPEKKFKNDFVDYFNCALTQAMFLQERNGVITKEKDEDSEEEHKDDLEDILKTINM